MRKLRPREESTVSKVTELTLMLTRGGVLDGTEAPSGGQLISQGLSFLTCFQGPRAWTRMASKQSCTLGKGLFTRQKASKYGKQGGKSWDEAMRSKM